MLDISFRGGGMKISDVYNCEIASCVNILGEYYG